MRFYGLSFYDVEALPYDKASDLLKAIDVLEAEEILNQLNVSAYPHMKKEGQDKTYKFWQKRAKSAMAPISGPLKLEDAAKILKGFQKPNREK